MIPCFCSDTPSCSGRIASAFLFQAGARNQPATRGIFLKDCLTSKRCDFPITWVKEWGVVWTKKKQNLAHTGALYWLWKGKIYTWCRKVIHDIAPNRIILSTWIPITDGETEAGSNWVSLYSLLEVLLRHRLLGHMLRGSDSICCGAQGLARCCCCRWSTTLWELLVWTKKVLLKGLWILFIILALLLINFMI